MTSTWSNFGDIETRNKSLLAGLEFECDQCHKKNKFTELLTSVIPAGFDYLCPKCHWIVLTAEQIEEIKSHETRH